jgi:hypothetical protein
MTQRSFVLAQLSLADERLHQIYLGLQPVDQRGHAVPA